MAVNDFGITIVEVRGRLAQWPLNETSQPTSDRITNELIPRAAAKVNGMLVAQGFDPAAFSLASTPIAYQQARCCVETLAALLTARSARHTNGTEPIEELLNAWGMCEDTIRNKPEDFSDAYNPAAQTAGGVSSHVTKLNLPGKTDSLSSTAPGFRARLDEL